MKYSLSLLLLVMLASTMTVFAEEQDTGAAPAAEPAIVLVAVGEVDPAVAERVRAFAQENLALPVRLLAAREATPAGSLNEIGEAARAAMGEADVCLVVLALPLEEFPNHGIMLPESRTAVVNVRALKPEDNDAERFGRRIEREAMLSIGLLLGLDPCPNPQCAMWLYSNNEELDAKGRNYCPPCLDRAQKLALEKGSKIVTESPFAPPPDEPESVATP